MLQVPPVSIRCTSLPTVGQDSRILFCTQVLQIQLQRINPNSLEHIDKVGKKSTGKKKSQLVRTEHPFKNSSYFLIDCTRFPFEQPEAWVHVIFFKNLVPSVHLLPKISFALPNCLSVKVYLCCFCACLLRLTWHLVSYSWKNDIEKFCVTLSLWKAGMPRVPVTTALRRE